MGFVKCQKNKIKKKILCGKFWIAEINKDYHYSQFFLELTNTTTEKENDSLCKTTDAH